jgi:hypothetical protein
MANGGAWFKPKSMGFGVTPITWQGWLATLVFVVVFATTLSYLAPAQAGVKHLLQIDRAPLLRDLRPNSAEVIAAVAVEMFVFLWLARFKTAEPRAGD